MSRWERYWLAPVAASRPYLVQKTLLALLALDCWVNLAERGAWYGAGGFNVPHFAILRVLTPLPSPALYVAVITLAGVLAGAMVLVRPHPAALALLSGLYTYGWAMSMQDSFQHHYLLSLLLLCLIFFPRHTARELYGEVGAGAAGALPAPRATTAWAYVLLGATCAVVYFYTAITKMEPDWREGHALMRLAEGSAAFVGLRARYLAIGGAPEGFWRAMAHGAIAVQLASSLGYLVCVHRDRLRRLPARLLATAWVAAPLSFHAGVEQIENMEIGWFSSYMIAIACVVFAPEPALRAVGAGLSLPWRWASGIWRGLASDPERAPDERWVGPVLAAVVTLCLGWIGREVDLPGASGALVLLGLGLLLATLVDARRGERLRTLPWLGASLVAAAVLLWALAGSEARFDFYRQAGGDFRRRGLPCRTTEEWVLCERGLAAYAKANHYAPEGRDRREHEDELRRLVELNRLVAPSP